MSYFLKRFILSGALILIIFSFAELNTQGQLNVISSSAADTDWSVLMADMIVNTRSTHMNWDYTVGLLLEGVLRVYKRTNDPKYLNFIKEWALYHISSDGTIDAQLNSLDNMMPGFTILHLYRETGIERFRLAATKIKDRLKNTYPRTPDGSFWHMTDLEGELWLDGLYMGMPFLVTYGSTIGDATYTYTEAIRQFRSHINYLKDNETGLLLHAYDYDGSASWSVPPLKRSPYAWGRAIGWVTMGLSEVLDIIPEGFPDRDIILRQYQDLLKSLVKYQDPKTGLWYQVVDRTSDPRNWLETSCSMMFVFSLQRAIQKGFLDASYQKYVTLGYNGILTKISRNADNTVSLVDICGGTGVSADINYYFNRPRVTNDNHGLGTFMIMNELVKYNNLPWIVSGPTSDHLIISPEIKLYPNPVSGILTIDYKDEDVIYFKIISAGGSVISTEKAVAPLQQIDFSAYGQGLYILEFTKADGSFFRKKILKH
jgi:unsaturated rhamnogalacturonyl hydrolase